MKKFLVLFLLAANVAYAEVISTKTETMRIETIDAVWSDCTPGIAPTKTNFPTQSVIHIAMPFDMHVASNSRIISALDPTPRRRGDHCEDLKKEIATKLPADLTVTRTLAVKSRWNDGFCVRAYTEQLDAKVAGLDLFSSDSFNIEEANRAECEK
jgi:hypothetical protein